MEVRGRRGWLMVGGAVALALWGTVGFFQGIERGFSGGIYDPDYRVPGLLPGGMAERSGFKVGDRIISVEGRPVEELGMESRWPRSLDSRPGQAQRWVVERNGQRIALDVVYSAPSPGLVNSRAAAGLSGLAFLVFGLWAFLATRTAAAAALAGIGLAAGAGMAFGLGPNLGGWWKGVQGHLSTAGMTLMFLLMLRFFLVFPREKRLSRSRVAAWLLYGAWGALLVFLSVELAVHPKLYYTTGAVAGPLTVVYGLLALAALVHTLVTTSRVELRAAGIPGIIAGFLAAVALVLAANMFWPTLPGWGYAMCVALVPLSMAMAVRKQFRSATETRIRAS